jgi:small GTP-binding protein
MLKYKIVLAGQEKVGKSSLIARFCNNVFIDTQPTIGVSFKRKKIQLNENISIEVNIWDFGGEQKYRILFPAYVNGASAALILYDTTSKKSLEDVENWIQIIDENADKKIVKVLIGAKNDLIDEKEVSFEEARSLSIRTNCSGDPIETSSKTGEKVEQAFLNVAKEILKRVMQKCKGCGELFNKKLKICNHCGVSIELKVEIT